MNTDDRINQLADEALARLHEAGPIWDAEPARRAIEALRAAALGVQGTGERETSILAAVRLAYGYLWSINTEPLAPIPLLTPDRAATHARLTLLAVMTRSDQRAGIEAARAALAGKADPKPV